MAVSAALLGVLVAVLWVWVSVLYVWAVLDHRLQKVRRSACLPIRPVPHPTQITAQRFADDGSHVYVTTADGRITRHEVLTPAMRDVVRQLAAARKGEQTPAALTLPQMWDMLGQPALAARERELERLVAEESSLRRSLGPDDPTQTP
jgi:hypothetical protein